MLATRSIITHVNRNSCNRPISCCCAM
jgi:hypothetical protein